MPFRPLRGYFYLYLHTTLIYTTITSYCVPPTFVRLRITSIQLRLHSSSFPFVPRPYPLHIDLDTLRSTSLLRSFIVLARILSILLRSHSIFCYIHRTSYMDPL